MFKMARKRFYASHVKSAGGRIDRGKDIFQPEKTNSSRLNYANSDVCKGAAQ